MEPHDEETSTKAFSRLENRTDTHVSSNLHVDLEDRRTQEERERDDIREQIELNNYLERLKQQHFQMQKEMYNEYKLLYIRNKDESIITLQVEGSKHSQFAFDVTIAEFIKDRVLHCVHIYNSIHDIDYNWQYQKDFVIDKYKSKIITSLSPAQGKLSIQDHDGYMQHPIDQIHLIALKNQASFLFTGYFSLKTQTLLPKHLNRGVDYLLGESKIPIIIFKEDIVRGKKNKGFKWLIVMDRSSSDCFKILDVFLPLMDLERDFIYGLTLIPPYVTFDDIKKQFNEKMIELNLRPDQYFYQVEEYAKKPSEIVKQFVNYNSEHYFNFVVFYNNPDKYKVDREKSETSAYVHKLSSNICFSNNVYFDKLENERKKKEQEQEGNNDY